MTDRPDGAIAELKTHQRQLDADGTEVGVSRQAVEEVLAFIEAQPEPAGDVGGMPTAKALARLRQHQKQANIWDEVSEEGDEGTEPVPQILAALRETIAIGFAFSKKVAALRAHPARPETLWHRVHRHGGDLALSPGFPSKKAALDTAEGAGVTYIGVISSEWMQPLFTAPAVPEGMVCVPRKSMELIQHHAAGAEHRALDGAEHDLMVIDDICREVLKETDNG